MGYYFIGIGGSGAKVMESLAHLNTAGLLPNTFNQEKLYVMAIDPDRGNGNLNRSSMLFTSIEGFQELAIGHNTPLLKTRIERANPFLWSPTEQDKKLDEIMAYQAYQGTPLGDLYEVLYTREERSITLNEGFRGRPSIGAAVMARKASLFNDERLGGNGKIEEPWNRFVTLVNEEIRRGGTAHIFLAGSVFGGTGAAGMPTIARLLRNQFPKETQPGGGSVVIGGALILPFFSFFPTEEEKKTAKLYATSENFITNTKAAIKYYASQNDSYDSMYFVGDNAMSPVHDFSIGAKSQENDAHMVDFYSALAAIDFFASDEKSRKTCAYITRKENERFTWTDFPTVRMEEIAGRTKEVSVKERLAQFTRFIFGYLHLVKPVLQRAVQGEKIGYSYPWFLDYFGDVNLGGQEVKAFDEYAERYVCWISQLARCENRSVEMVKPNTFEAMPAKVEGALFDTCIYGEQSEISMHELWTRLAEHRSLDDPGAVGFGRFLRALYDCCSEQC